MRVVSGVSTMLMMAAGCAHEQKPAVAAAPAPVAAVNPQLKIEAQAPQRGDEGRQLDDLLKGAVAYFDFNDDRLNAQGLEALRNIGEVLRRSPGLHIRVEGNCDERGTAEYNLMLGHRRAAVAAKYLADLGVKQSQVELVSFGAERPAVPEHSESAWAKNRRDEVVKVAQ